MIIHIDADGNELTLWTDDAGRVHMRMTVDGRSVHTELTEQQRVLLRRIL